MNKPLTMIIEETKIKLAEACNEALKSGLTPASLDLIVQNIYSEVHSIAEKQAFEDKIAYLNTIKNNNVEAHPIENDSQEVLNENEVDE